MVHAGNPKTVILGDLCTNISTNGDFVKSLLPSNVTYRFTTVIAEVTQNLVDWTHDFRRKEMTNEDNGMVLKICN